MVTFVDVCKIYNGNVKAVNNLNLTINKGEMVVFIGPSGCGKTTTLKMVNRLIQPTSGKIIINGIDTNDMNAVELRRQIGYVIQDIALFPHRTVASNIATVPRLKKWETSRINKIVDDLLEMVDMDPAFYRDRYPNELSGGQQQRIGVLRALAAEPEVMLMDEPFGALDPITREQLQDELKRLQKMVNKTIIFVTHDMDEALKIADRIVIMKDGEIIQVASPEEILRQPANAFVRSFIGEERLIRQPELVVASEVMLRKPVCMEYDKGLHQGIETMREEGVDSLLIIDRELHYMGVVEVSSIQKNLNKVNALQEIMIEWPTVEESDSVKEVVRLMVENNLRFIPVVNKSGKVKGIVTRARVVNFVLDYL
ncbi:ABC transporter ATP-binding protein [Acidaminobacter hydrogenoformans]|uniref:Quaternary amine transport ATP-binding protein n=1 Tax=Acidaminobacter hydrogenoformans DSM 2784 TaxID=1120920 RepID=A0A1G5S7E7_9FIRM|nr:betaine/proline/choline family ABC transporter ATP-binding protein [Acidaminobacter hydrogenoformans]SCZ81820.1 osmoprotectant transport system ATP-binding protein [Acidaminobacter hydrogenoformans DSM 2784]